MSLTVCLAPANTVAYPNGGGHLWVYLNWALALKALGCRVIWLEGIDVDDSDTSPAGRRRRRGGRAVDCVATLKTRLEPYGLADTLALYAMNGAAVPEDVAQGSLDLDAAAGADLLLNLWHSAPAPVVQRFRRSAFIDTDPGLLQIWVTTGAVCLARAGGLPRRIPRGVPAAARAKGMAAAGGMGPDRDPGRVPDIRAALARRVQLRQAGVRLARHRLGE